MIRPLIFVSTLWVAELALAAEPVAQPATPEAAAPDSQNAPPATSAAAAEDSGAESICKQGKNIRRVKLKVSEQSCEVLYSKETEKPGTEDKLWEFKHEQDKCKKNFTDFVEKLRGMGWNCI